MKSDSTTHALGIDIGMHTIKAVLLRETESDRIERCAIRILTPPGAVQDGIIVKPREVAAQLRKVVRETGCRPKSASCSIPIEQSLVRWIDLPRMDLDALRTATPFEARKYLPYPVENAEVEIVPMEHVGSEEEGRLRALLVAAPREVVRSRAEVLEMAGLEVASAEMEPFALIRALHPFNVRNSLFWRGQSMAYLLLGVETSGICVVQDTSLRFVRAISWGGQRLTQALASALGSTMEEAEAIKTSPSAQIGLGDLNEGLFSWEEGGERRQVDTLTVELERLRREIERLINYYRSLFPERSYEGSLGRICLCGGTANLKGLDRFFSHILQVDVVTLDPIESIDSASSDASVATQKLAQDRQADFAVALGLALGQRRHEGGRMRLQESERDESDRKFVWRRRVA